MRLGISCKSNWLTKKNIEKIKKARIKIIEIDCERSIPNKEEIEFLKNLKFDYSVHAPYNNIKLKIFPYPRYSKKCIREIEESLDYAVKLKASQFVIHGGSFIRGYFRFRNLIKKNYGLKFFLDRFIKNFQNIFKRANNAKIKVVLENVYPCFIGGRVFDIKYIQKNIPFVGFCLDLAHSEIYNLTEELMKLNINHIHISDNNKKEDKHL